MLVVCQVPCRLMEEELELALAQEKVTSLHPFAALEGGSYPLKCLSHFSNS